MMIRSLLLQAPVEAILLIVLYATLRDSFRLPLLLTSISKAYDMDQSESSFPGMSWQISLGVIKVG